MNDLNLQLPTEIVERAVRDKINSAIAEQLGDPTVIITKLVSAALAQKVSADGTVSNRSYNNEYEFLDLLTGNFIRDAAQEALKEYLNVNLQAIKEAVKKEVARSPSKFAKLFVDGITESMNTRFSSTVRISFDGKDS